MVNEIQHDSDGTYNYSDVADQIDTYKTEEMNADKGLSPVPGVSHVKAVQVFSFARWEGAGADIKHLLRSGTVNDIKAEHVIMGGYDRCWTDEWGINPFTGQAWTFEEVDALQVGIKNKARG